MIRPDRLARAIAADVLLTFADACRAWVARQDERMASALGGDDDE